MLTEEQEAIVLAPMIRVSVPELLRRLEILRPVFEDFQPDESKQPQPPASQST